MSTFLSFHRSALAAAQRLLWAVVLASVTLGSMPATVRADNIIYVTNEGSGTIGEYTTSGATVNASLVSGLDEPFGIAVSGSDLFVADYGYGRIGEYTTSGATVNASLVSGLICPAGIAVSGPDLFVATPENSTIGEYTTSGATVNASLVSGLSNPHGIAVSGSNLFVANWGNGTIGEYTTSGATVNASLVSGLGIPLGLFLSGSDLFVTNMSGTIGEYTTSGATVNASLVSGLSQPAGIAVSGSDLFVTIEGNNTIGEYTTSGATVNASLVSGLISPAGIAVVPEPSSLALLFSFLAVGSLGLLGYVWRRPVAKAWRPPAVGVSRVQPTTQLQKGNVTTTSHFDRRRVLIAVLGLATIAMAGTTASAETLVYNFAFQDNDYPTFPQFDPSVGFLQSVTLTLNNAYFSEVQPFIFQNGNPAVGGTVSLTEIYDWELWCSAGLSQTGSLFQSESGTVAPYVGFLESSGPTPSVSLPPTLA